MMRVLTIGYDRQVFGAHSEVRARMRACAEAAGELHMVIFSQAHHACAEVHDGPLHMYPTQSRGRLALLSDAYRIGKQLLQVGNREEWIISPQDPFEAGSVGYLLHRRSGMPLQVQLHGDFFGNRWWRKSARGNWLREWIGRWLVRRATCVRVVSARVERSVRALGIPASRIARLSVVTGISMDTKVDPAHDLSAPHLRQAGLRAQYPNASAIVLTAGRLVRSKHFDRLVRAFAHVHAAHPHAQLVIVGSGPEEQALRTCIAVHELTDAVTLLPWSDDLAALMQTADIFAFPSSYEGWGRVVLEAMAAGMPGVVTNVGCVGEVFADGKHGRVVPVDDVDELAESIAALIADPALREKYGAAAQADVAAYVLDHAAYARAWRETLLPCTKQHDRV